LDVLTDGIWEVTFLPCPTGVLGVGTATGRSRLRGCIVDFITLFSAGTALKHVEESNPVTHFVREGLQN
jgi:hypothetical protein